FLNTTDLVDFSSMVTLLKPSRDHCVFDLIGQASFFFVFVCLLSTTTETVVAPVCECNDLGDCSTFGDLPADFFFELFMDAFERVAGSAGIIERCRRFIWIAASTVISNVP